MTPLLSLPHLYLLSGGILALAAGRILFDRTHPRRWGSCVFWALLAVVFAVGDKLPPLIDGYAVVIMVILSATKQVAPPRLTAEDSAFRRDEALRLKNWIFLPALIVPVVALLGARFAARLHGGGFVLVAEKQAALVSLGLGSVLAVVVALRLTRAKWATPVRRGSLMLESLGWALVLPQLLAALGGIFQQSGVGPVVARITTEVVPLQFPFVAVAVYCLAMALFTVCMGNAFAAFAVITGGIGVPVIVLQHHGNPAIMAAIGMLSGYCGTLMTPMAANFNIVPAMLLELPDRNAVIKAQLPIAIVLLAANIGLMYLCVYRF